jgi:hypothetical protein
MISEPVLLHLHIPKAGGKTIQDVLYSIYADGNDVPEESDCLVNGVYWYPLGFEADSYSVPRGDVFAALAGRDDIRVVSGHFPFGIHEIIPRQYHYVTVLREPVARVNSLYHHVRRSSYNLEAIHERVVSENISLDDFVAKIRYLPIDNGQVRLLSGENPDFGECTEAMLQIAKNNLSEHFAVTGILERFDETIEVMSDRLGWNIARPEYEAKHVNLSGDQEIAAKSRKLIQNFNQLDIELYQFADGLLSEMSDTRVCVTS